MAIIEAADIPTLSLLYKLGKLTASPGAKPPPTLLGPSTLPAPSKALNGCIGLIRNDITTLRVDAIVNAANSRLAGGGGIDGAIHRAAGPGLAAECRTLNGCPTGSAKITSAYNLLCGRVIHAVGPVYSSFDSEACEVSLTGCYTKSLQLAAANRCRTVALCAISTGVYGYPSRAAAAAALSAVRKFLVEGGDSKIDKVVFVTFEQKDVDAYNEFLPLYFPPVPDQVPTVDSEKAEEKKAEEAKLDAEAQAVASELPSPPALDPADAEHVEKKQKHDNKSE